MPVSNNTVSQLSVTPGAKEDDESGTFACTFSGPFLAAQVVNVRFARKGNIVTLCIDAISSGAPAGFSSVATGNTALGSNLCPLATVLHPVSCLTGSSKSNTLGKVSIDSSGNILVYRDHVETGLWLNTGNNGWEQISFSYLLF